MPDCEPHVQISITSRLENIELLALVAEASICHFGLCEETVEPIVLAVREAVANGVQHGNRLRPDKRVDVDLRLHGDDAIVRVTDEGDGFDPGTVPDPLAPENLLKPTGRGIFLMRQLMDEVHFQFGNGCGTVVTMRKGGAGRRCSSGRR